MRLLPEQDGRPRVMAMEITSLVDVVFLLIIFFLTTSSLADAARAPVDLPQEEGEAEVGSISPGLIVNIDASGSFIVDGEAVAFERVVDMLAREVEEAGDPSAVDLLVRADKAAPLVHLNDLAKALVERGVTRWRLGTQTPQAGAP